MDMYSYLEKLIPHTLFRRMALLFALLLVCAQIITAALFHAIQVEPHAEHAAFLIRTYAIALDLSLANTPPNRISGTLATFSQHSGLQILKNTQGMLPGQAAEGPFAQRLQIYLRSHYGLTVALRREFKPYPAFWVLMPTKHGRYWLQIPADRLTPPRIAYKWMFRIGFVGFVSLLAALFIVWIINRPLKRLADSAGAINPSDPDARIQIQGPDEIKRLAETLNAMLNNIRHHEREKTLMLAGISHDLRTPLARIRLEAELLNNRNVENTRIGIIKDTEEMNAIIGQFLDYARAEQAEAKIQIDLNTIVSELSDRYGETDHPISQDLAPLPKTCLQPLSMKRLITNLIDNAIQHGGNKIQILTRHINDEIHFCIIDNGPGIDPSITSTIFEPFVRGNSARSGKGGAGLGLAIAARIASLHQGRITLQNRQPHGLEVNVYLPVLTNCEICSTYSGRQFSNIS